MLGVLHLSLDQPAPPGPAHTSLCVALKLSPQPVSVGRGRAFAACKHCAGRGLKTMEVGIGCLEHSLQGEWLGFRQAVCEPPLATGALAALVVCAHGLRPQGGCRVAQTPNSYTLDCPFFGQSLCFAEVKFHPCRPRLAQENKKLTIETNII